MFLFLLYMCFVLLLSHCISVVVFCIISQLAIIPLLFVAPIMGFVLLLSHCFDFVVFCIISYLAIISL